VRDGPDHDAGGLLIGNEKDREDVQIMKTPRECSSLGDIRVEIDRIDHQIITALGERFTYVKAAAMFKTNAADVAAPDRVTAMIAQRRAWASEQGLNPDVIDRIYRELVTYFTSEEALHWHGPN